MWDRAVTTLAVYRARHQPDAPAHELGTRPDPTAADEAAQRWQRLRTAAERLAGDWLAAIDGHHQAVSRTRAVAGIHPLLDHGWPPPRWPPP